MGEEDWAFAYHLYLLHQRWVYLRRVLRRVRCVNPETGLLDVPFEQLVESENWVNYPDERWVAAISEEFFEDTCRLLTTLAYCVAFLAPEAYTERLEIWAEDLIDEEIEELRNYGQKASLNRARESWQLGFLFNVMEAHSVVCKWEEKLNQLRADEFLLMWKQVQVRRGARIGGAKAAQTKAKVRQASPDTVREHYERLLAQGHTERSIAAKVAERLNVTSDHVRRVRRLFKEKPT